MDSERPSKRRRKDDSSMEDSEDEEDDDELIFQPFEHEAKSDPGYRFSIERAYSDHRFQATMAHIFEKYGRNFEGIGDEIDLMTGEIVVDNGHVHNMRNEGDVGDDIVQEREDQEDEGLLLEELTDGEDEQTGQDEENVESEPEQDSDEQTPQGRYNKERSIHEYQSPHHSMALVARSPTQSLGRNWARHPPGLMPPAFWPSPYGNSPFGFGFGAGASPLAFGPSPLAFGASPFPAAPWDIPGPHYEPQWANSQAQPAQSIFTGHRYNFKVQRGSSSIWAQRSKYKEDEDEPLRSVFDIALGKHLFKAKSKARKSLPAPAALPMPSGDDEDDEDEEAILSGKSTRKKAPSIMKTTDTSHNHDDDQDNEAGLLPFGHTMTEKRQDFGKSSIEKDIQNMHKATVVKPAAKRGQKRRRNSKQDVVSAGTGDESSIDSVSAFVNSEIINGESEAKANQSQSTNGIGGRRNPSRTRKQVESSNSIPGREGLEERRLHVVRVELPSLSRHSRSEYQEIEVVDSIEDNFALSDGESPSDDRSSAPTTKSSHAQGPISPGAHYDLAQSLLEDTGDDEQHSPGHISGNSPVHDSGRDRLSEGDSPGDEESVHILPSDEDPPILANVKFNRRREIRTRSASKRHLHENTGPYRPDMEFRADFESREGKRDHEVANLFHLPKADEGKAGGQEILDSRIDDSDAYSEPNDGVSPSYDPFEVSDSEKEVQHEIAESRNILAHPSGYLSEVVPFSSSPTRSLARFTEKVPLNDEPTRLLREKRWLRKRASTPSPCVPTLHKTPSSPTEREPLPERRGRSRPGKWANNVEQLESENHEDGHADFQISSSTDWESIQESQRYYMKQPLEQTEDESTARKALEDPELEAMPASPQQDDLPAQASRDSISLQSSPRSSTLHDTLPTKSIETPTWDPKNLKTPRHSQHISTNHTPSSRRSILSLESNNADNEEVDELRRSLAAMPGGLHSSGARPRSVSARKIWRSSALTTEIYRTPIKKRPNDPVSPGSLVRTPGGTMRACGMNGYRCGRDFCFTCL